MNQLSVVILNFNGQDYLRQFLPTVLQCSGEHEVVVADNASTDDSVKLMRQQMRRQRKNAAKNFLKLGSCNLMRTMVIQGAITKPLPALSPATSFYSTLM